MTNVHSQTNGQQSQGCSVTPSASKHGSVGLDDLSGGTTKRSGAAAGGGGVGKDTMTQSTESCLPDCATTTSVLSQAWTGRSPPAGSEDREKASGERAPVVVLSPTSSKPKRKPAPSKPGSVCSYENLPSSSPRPPSVSSSTASPALLPSTTPLENLNTNRNNSTCLNQTPPSPFSSPLATPSPVPSIRFRETPILRRAPCIASSSASTKYKTLPVEEGGRSRARRRYSLSEGGSKTHSSNLRGGGAAKIGRIMRNKRSQSMSGMLLHKDNDEDSEKGRCDSDWILESTVWAWLDWFIHYCFSFLWGHVWDYVCVFSVCTRFDVTRLAAWLGLCPVNILVFNHYYFLIFHNFFSTTFCIQFTPYLFCSGSFSGWNNLPCLVASSRWFHFIAQMKTRQSRRHVISWFTLTESENTTKGDYCRKKEE